MCLDVCDGSGRVLCYASGSTTMILVGSGDGVPDAAFHPTIGYGGHEPHGVPGEDSDEAQLSLLRHRSVRDSKGCHRKKARDIWFERWSAHIFARLPRDDGRGIYIWDGLLLPDI
jgi:hypothetical protein